MNGPGEPDDLERLWTPHRMAYIAGENKPVDDLPAGCPFCLANRDDLENLQKEPAGKAKERRKRISQASAGYLGSGKEG